MQLFSVFDISSLILFNLVWNSTALAMADPISELGQTLSTTLAAKVLLPGTSEYNESTTSYYSAFENELKPLFVLKPTSKEDVATIITAVKPYAGSGRVHLAIRGGGASPPAGLANINRPGITIDMRSVTGVTISPDKKTVSIGAGELWGNVYAKLESSGLAVAGGRSSRLGVGGHITNGLFWFHSVQPLKHV
jgi:FAD/FMN-containing dehydrogenase